MKERVSCMKKALSLLLATALIFGMTTVLTSCDSGSGMSTTTATASATTAATTSAATTASATTAATTASATTTAASSGATTALALNNSTHYDISYYAYWCADAPDTSNIKTEIETKLNITVNIKHVNHQSADEVNLMYASGEMPDCLWSVKSPSFMFDEQDLARTIPLDAVEEYAPDFIKIYDETPILWALAYAGDDQTQLYGLPGVSDTYTRTYLWCDYYRYDWIEDLGIDMGTNVEKINDTLYIAENGITLDKYKEILETFASKSSNIIPATWNGGSAPQVHLGAFGLNTDNVEENGKLQFYYATDAYKEYLAYFADLYKEGLIDKEFITQDRSQAWDKINKGLSGYFTSSTNTLNSWANTRPPLTVWQNISEAKLVMTPGLASKSGDWVSYNGSSTPFGGEYFYINKEVNDDETLNRILQFVEYTNFAGDVESYWYGEKGTDWEDDASNPGFPKILSEIKVPEKDIQIFCRNMQVGEVWDWLSLQPLYMQGMKYYEKSAGGLWLSHLTYPYKSDITKTTDYTEVNKEVGSNVTTVRDEYFSNVILGKVDLNSTWDQYLSDLNSAGYEKLRSALEEAPVVTELIAQYSGQ